MKWQHSNLKVVHIVMPINEWNMHAQSLLRLMQLVSPTLPIGSYAYSQGLEYAVNAEWVTNEKSAHEWIFGIFHSSIICLDVPVLMRIYNAWTNNDIAAVTYWTDFLLANRESAELRREDEQMGKAMLRILLNFQVQEAQHCAEKLPSNFVMAFSLAACKWRIPQREAALGFCWAWAEKQVASAIKLVPLGQSAGLRMLEHMAKIAGTSLDIAISLQDEDLGAVAPQLAIASALHETQYTRLFQS